MTDIRKEPPKASKTPEKKNSADNGDMAELAKKMRDTMFTLSDWDRGIKDPRKVKSLEATRAKFEKIRAEIRKRNQEEEQENKKETEA